MPYVNYKIKGCALLCYERYMSSSESSFSAALLALGGPSLYKKLSSSTSRVLEVKQAESYLIIREFV